MSHGFGRAGRSLAACATVLVIAVTAFEAQDARTIVFEGARLITGDNSAPIENGVLLVRGGRVTAVGPQGKVSIPPDAVRVALTGKTIMPAMVNAHVHIGYEGYTSWGAANHTPANVLDHLRREAYYGVAAATTVGSSPTAMSLQFIRDQQAGKYPPVARLLFMPGMAPPNGGPDHILREATTPLKVINEVTTAADAREAIRRLAAQKIAALKIWVDDRRGTYPKMPPEVYEAAIDEAHRHKMLVHAHATTLEDQKAVVRAGADVLVHMVQSVKIDDELMSILKEKRPYWATVIGLGDPTEVCKPDPFFEDALPATLVASIRAKKEATALSAHCAPPAPTAAGREERVAYNFPRMIEAGVRLVLGTDTGIHPGHTFGSGEHVELARWVQLGLSPADAIVAATSRPAQLLGLDDLGTLAPGKRASFIVLDANPLENIRNTRQIRAVYLDGREFDRAAVRREWARKSGSN
jgi:imidazolonepropionase-like amidohydrolase